MGGEIISELGGGIIPLRGAASSRNSGAASSGISTQQPPLRVQIVKRTDDMKGFVVLPRRWVVERTFSWFGRNRRLNKDYKNLADTLAAFSTMACIQLALRRLAQM